MRPIMETDQFFFFFSKEKGWKGRFIERLQEWSMKPQEKKKKKARVRDNKSHQGSFGASFHALLDDFSLYIFLRFHGGNHGHWGIAKVSHLNSRHKTWQGLEFPRLNSKFPCKGLWQTQPDQVPMLGPLNCVLGTRSHCVKDCSWSGTVAMWKGQGHSQKGAAGQTTQWWTYTFGLESILWATTGWSSQRRAMIKSLSLSISTSATVTSPVLTPQGGLWLS